MGSSSKEEGSISQDAKVAAAVAAAASFGSIQKTTTRFGFRCWLLGRLLAWWPLAVA